MTARILIIEDEEPLTLLLRYNLEAEGYEVDTTARGDEGDLKLKEGAPDLAVIDWMLPGVKPTGKYVEVPLVAIINFRGDKLYHEHIYWDQASVLAQIGLIDPKNLPIAGRAQAQKLIDETRPSNTLMARWPESETK